jgi:hypothetical protein
MTVYSREEVANRGLHWREVSPMMYTTITNGRAVAYERARVPPYSSAEVGAASDCPRWCCRYT